MKTNGFLIELHNYEYGVERIIPSAYDPTDQEIHEAFYEELLNLLTARSHLEKALQMRPNDPELTQYAEKIAQLDRLLRAKKSVVLALMPPETGFWKKMHRRAPRSHWWYYLDEIDETEKAGKLMAAS